MTPRAPSSVSAAGKRGFTLVEMMVAIWLSFLVILALSGIFMSVMKFQVHGYKKNVMQSSTTISLKSLLRDIEQATTISQPSSPCPNGDCSGSTAKPGDILLGCTNYDEAVGRFNDAACDGVNDKSCNVRIFQYCVASCNYPAPRDTMKCLYRTWNEGPALTCNPAPAPVACRSALSGTNLEIVAQGVDKDTCGANCGNYFLRPAGTNNVVEIHFKIDPNLYDPQGFLAEAVKGVEPIHLNSAITASRAFGSAAP